MQPVVDSLQGDEQTGAKQRTFVQMLWDSDALYVSYRVDDTDITARFLERDDPTFLDDAVAEIEDEGLATDIRGRLARWLAQPQE